MDVTVPESGPLLAVPTARPQWMHYGDVIRILGTMAVVIGHVADMTLFQARPESLNWWVCNLWDAAMRWAVPIYIMLSGSLLLDPARAELPRVFYRKRLARLGVPLVFWSLFFMWLDVYYTGWRATTNAAYEAGGTYLWADHTRWQWFVYLVFEKPQQAWRNLLIGQPYMHMHFMFRIAGLYAFTPVLRVLVKHLSRPMLTTLVVMLLTISAADTVANNLTETSLSMFFRFVPFLGYYLFGYLMREPVQSGKGLAWACVGFVASAAVLAGGTGLLVHRFFVPTPGHEAVNGPPSLPMMLYDFVSPVRVVMALCAWVILVRLFRDPWPHGKTGRAVLRFWANTTLGLYLIHPLFREAWYMAFQYGNHRQLLAHGIDATWPTTWPGMNPTLGIVIGVPLVALMVYVPALVSTIVLMRIPFVRRITG